MAIGDLITAVQYNNIRTKIIGVLGPGTGTSGYGQALQSSNVAVTQLITVSQWNQLRADIFNTLLHQTGTFPSIFTATTGSLIRFGTSFPVNQYDTLSNTAITNRFNIGTDQFAIEGGTASTGTSVELSEPWSTSVSCTVTVSFANATQARYFFNSGGKIRFQSSRIGGSATAQNTSWTNLLNAAGIREFGGTTPSVNFYNLTNAYQIWYSTTASAPYSSNTYRLEALCNVANNSAGTASQITFRITWLDPYVDPGPPEPGDSVDGTLGLIVTQLRATGDLYNENGAAYATFSIQGPTSYTPSAITFS